jgi:hypothetical protein
MSLGMFIINCQGMKIPVPKQLQKAFGHTFSAKPIVV